MEGSDQGSFNNEYFKKRGSWSSSTLPYDARPERKKRGSAPQAMGSLVKEYLSQYGQSGNPVPPPPGYEALINPETCLSSEAFFSVTDDEIIDKLPSLCRSQYGSRKAQSIIQHASALARDRIVQLLCPCMSALMVDSYANYACQTLVQTCSPAQRLLLIREMEGDLVKIAMDSRGTHALQKLITLVNLEEEEAILVSAFEQGVVSLSRHQHASHVIQKVITTVRNNGVLVDRIARKLEVVSMDQLGLLVVKACISSARNDQATFLRQELISKSLQLIQDPFGNYAIKQMLETWGWTLCRDILTQLQGKIAQLSQQKFASNIIERLLEMATETDRLALMDELANQYHLRELLENKFGQFVLKKALAIGGETFAERIKALIESFPVNSKNQKRGKWDPILRILN